MKYFPTLILGAAVVALPILASADKPLDIEQYRTEAVEKWEEDIAQLEAKDAEENHPDDSILFIGSSSIRLWKEIEEDLSPYHPIQRGFGGSKFSDLGIYADRLITPHRFRAVVIFCANDIAGKDTDKTPEEVVELFSFLRAKIRKHNPDAPVFYIPVTPTPKRWDVYPVVRKANLAIRDLCLSDPNTHYIGTESIFLDAAGQPRPEFFVEDQLHLNRDGYLRWSAAVKSHLDTVLGGAL